MQLVKMRRRGMYPEVFEKYLMMHRHGMPPHGGLGIGLERLTARLLGVKMCARPASFPGISTGWSRKAAICVMIIKYRAY